MDKKRRFRWQWLLILPVLVLLALAIWSARRAIIIQQAHNPSMSYDPNAWFEIAPEGAVTAEGEPMTTRMRVGSDNKVIVFFFGGGISLDEYTAARPYIGTTIDREPGFYTNSAEDMLETYCELGIGSRQEDNPFRDWSVIVIPYATGDFHIGTGEFDYTDLNGEKKTLYHHGYYNYRAIMDEAVQYIGSAPEELLIAGFSAGGYGAAILAGDVMETYFPDAGHVTVCVDSSLLILDNWAEVMTDVWSAPEEIVSKVKSLNLVVDYLEDLYNTYGDSVTYLYIGSLRDGALAKYQAYFDTGVYRAGNNTIWVYTSYLRVMIHLLQDKVPGIGIYLFDRLPFSWIPWLNRLTQHTILPTQTAFWPLTNGQSAIEWLSAAVDGNVRSVGLEKLR